MANGKYNVYLFKTNASRNVQWQKTFGENQDDVGGCIRQTTDGGYVLVGSTDVTNEGRQHDIYLIKTDANGNKIWENALGGSGTEDGMAVELAEDGGYVIAGSIYNYNSNPAGNDIFIVKTDSEGNMVWDKRFGSSSVDKAHDIQKTLDGAFIVAGTYHTSSGKKSWIAKIDYQGNVIWEKYDTPLLQEIYSIQVLPDGGMTIAGVGQNRIYVAKLNTNGEALWVKGGFKTGTFSDEVRCIRQTADNGYILCGNASNNWLDQPVLVIKTDDAGNMLWKQTISGGAKYGAGYDVRQTPDGGYIVAGHMFMEKTNIGLVNSDAYLIKLDGNGVLE
jgi:hypothetical protein